MFSTVRRPSFFFVAVMLIALFVITHPTASGQRRRQRKQRAPKVSCPLPVRSVPQFLLVAPSGEFVLVTNTELTWEGHDLKLFVGPAADMTGVPVQQANGNRCGAFWLYTQRGILTYHTPDAKEKPLWKDLELREVSIEDYRIEQKGNSFQVRPRKVSP